MKEQRKGGMPVSVSLFYKTSDRKEENRVQNKDDAKRKSQEPTGFKIPKKVRSEHVLFRAGPWKEVLSS